MKDEVIYNCFRNQNDNELSSSSPYGPCVLIWRLFFSWRTPYLTPVLLGSLTGSWFVTLSCLSLLQLPQSWKHVSWLYSTLVMHTWVPPWWPWSSFSLTLIISFTDPDHDILIQNMCFFFDSKHIILQFWKNFINNQLLTLNT